MENESLEIPPEDLHGGLVPRRRRWPWVVVAIIALAVVGTGAAYAWLNAPSVIQQLTARGTAPSGPDADDKAILTDLMAAQQKTAEDLAGVDRALAEQGQQLTGIAGRLSELSSKLEALQEAVVASRPAVAPAPVPQVSVPTSPTIVRPAAVSAAASKPKKQPRAAPASGPISVGGVPLVPREAQGAR